MVEYTSEGEIPFEDHGRTVAVIGVSPKDEKRNDMAHRAVRAFINCNYNVTMVHPKREHTEIPIGTNAVSVYVNPERQEDLARQINESGATLVVFNRGDSEDSRTLNEQVVGELDDRVIAYEGCSIAALGFSPDDPSLRVE
jgi:predicted CoA-binding protein